MSAQSRVVGKGNAAVRIYWTDSTCEVRTCDRIVRGNSDFGKLVRAWADDDSEPLMQEFGITAEVARRRIDSLIEDLSQQGVILP